MENKLLSVVGTPQPRAASREDFLCSWCLWLLGVACVCGANSGGRNRMACRGGGSLNKMAFHETRTSSDA